jgi:hypothetical protein
MANAITSASATGRREDLSGRAGCEHGISATHGAIRITRRAPVPARVRSPTVNRLAGIASLAVVLGIGGCAWGEDADAPADDEAAALEAVQDYVAALADADPAAVCALLTQAELDDLEVTSSCREVFAHGFELLREKRVEIPEYEISGVVVDGDRGEATLRSEATDEVVPLAREDGQWKLAGSTSIDQFHPDDPLADGRGS